MALADTARLIATLELQDKFSGPANTALRSLDGLDQRSRRLGLLGEHIGQGIRSTATNIARLGVVAGGVIAVNVKAGIQSLAELQRVEQLTATALKSTGSAAAGSAEDIRKRSLALEDLTTVDDKAIQNAQNLLLTFRQIGPQAFEPTLKAAIDLNAALGGDENSLQGRLIQVGKAVNDPIKGLTALRRVGVSFTAEQEKQIKALVDAGRTMDAQRVILRELNKEFAGAGKAFGTGPAADMRRFGDAVEEAQQALATGFLPLIRDVSRQVQEALAKPEVIASIRSLGEGLAGTVRNLIDIGTRLPWGAIGNAAKVMGQGAKFLLEAFTGLPPWVQTAVLTGWGLNKLTGGALGNIFGDVIKLAFPKLDIFSRGATPANPMWVAQVGGAPGTGAPVAGGGGALATVAKFVLGPAAAVVIGAEIAAVINRRTIEPAQTFEQTQFKAVLDSGDVATIVHGLDAIERAQHDPRAAQQLALIASNIPFIGDALGHVGPELEAQRQQLIAQLEQMGLTREAAEALVKHAAATKAAVDDGNRYAASLNTLVQGGNRTQSATHAAVREGNRYAQSLNVLVRDGNQRQDATKRAVDLMHSRTVAHMQSILAAENRVGGNTAAIARKDFSPEVNVAVTTNTSVSVNDVVRAITSSYIASRGAQILRQGI
jgi:hypothetical protein